jgi:hypothetical protein
MSDPEFARRRVLSFRTQHQLNNSEEIHANLGVNAFSILSEKKFDVTNQSCFLFLVIRLNASQKPFPIRLKPFPHGSADQIIQHDTDEILILLEECHCFIHFVASDGDPGQSPRHRAFFTHWFEIYI